MGGEKINKLAARYSPYKDYNEPKEKPKVTHKVCATCGRKLPIDSFYRGKGRGGHIARCRECMSLYYRKLYSSCEYLQKKAKERARKWREEHPNEVKKKRILYYERRKVVRNRATAELHDGYIIQLLLAQGLTREEITPKVIEIKRQQVADSRRYRKILTVNTEEDIENED